MTLNIRRPTAIVDVAGRADLEQHFDNSHTIIALGTKFDEAPSVHTRNLLERAGDAGARAFDTQTAVLALARPEDAIQMTESGGVPVETVQDGYDLKAEQATQTALAEAGRSIAPFLELRRRRSAKLRVFLRDRIADLRASHRARLQEIVAGAEALLNDLDRRQLEATVRQAFRPLRVWLQNNSALAAKVSAHVQDSLVDATAVAHPSTIRAFVARDGDWHRLSYGHHLGHGARRMAVQVLGPKFEGFREIARKVL